MKNLNPILLVISCTLFTGLGQILFKLSAGSLTDFYSIIFSIPLLLGLISYAIGAILLIMSLKHGELSIIYPFIALSFIWVDIASIFIFAEAVSVIEWLGIVAIIGGISFIGYGGSRR